MKKFTRNFLLGEHSIARFLRKIGLSLVVLLWTFMTYAQESQDTYHVWAENVSTCYQEDNTYEVKVSMKDFIAIHEFSLKLNFNNTQFAFNGVSEIHQQLQAGWQAPVVSGGSITFSWVTTTTPVTIAETDDLDDGLPVFTLKFNVNGYQHFYTGIAPTPFVSSLTWNGSDSYYKNLPDQVDIKTFEKVDGSLTVTEQWSDITVDITAADCFGGNVIATVTSPANVAGMQYSWNGATFTNNASTNIPYPSYDQTVKVRNTASPGCISYVKVFDVTEGPAAVTFDTEPVVQVNCPEGNGDIEIFATGGKAPYTYYVVPSAMWSNFTNQAWFTANPTQVNLFKSQVPVFQKPVGTYYVAVQDDNGCVNLFPWTSSEEDAYLESWEVVEVIDTLDTFDADITWNNPSCYDSSNGIISIQNITGGTPFAGGYDIYVNNVWTARSTSYSSMTRPAGTYNIMIRDARGCSWTPAPIALTQPQRIVFTVDWSDTGCTQSVGQLFIDEIISGGTGYDSLTWQYSTDITWQQNVSEVFAIDEIADSLAAGIYYVRIISYKMVGNQALACEHRWQNDQGDDAVKILDTDFDIVVEGPKCTDDQAKVTVSLASGSGNHEFEYYMKNGDDDNGEVEVASTTDVPGEFWVGPFEPGTWNTVYFYAYDITAECEYELSASIYQPTAINAYIIPYLTVPPTCPEEADGNLTIQVSGGTPFDLENEPNVLYEVKLDNGNWRKVGSTFSYGLDNKLHRIYIRDANMCETELWFDLPDFQNKISFVDEIWLSCPTDMVNLFNGYPEECDESVFGFCVDGIDMDLAYFNIWESQWHGIPLEHFFADAWQPMYLDLVVQYLDSLGFEDFNVDEMVDIINNWGSFDNLDSLFAELDIESYGNFDDITLENLQEILTNSNILYRYWTSDQGWKTVVTQGIEYLRNPMLHWRAQGSTEWEILTHTTSFGPGVYEVVAWDEFGCMSNIETIHVRLTQGPIFLTTNTTTEPAGCFGQIDGKIIIDASRNIYLPNTSIYDLEVPIPGTPFGNPVVQYSIVAEGSQAIFNQPSWWEQLSWLPMDDYNHMHVAKQGNYWVVIRDYCATLDPTLIVRQLVTVEGKDELEVTGTTVTTNVTCNIVGYTPSNNGTVQIGTVEGGYGDYTYHLLGTTIVNSTGYFSGLAAGNYSVTITDAEGCSIVTTFTITQPAPFSLETQVAYPSCNDVFDGFIRYFVHGGTAPFQEVTNNFTAQERLNPNSIPENRWVDVTTSGTNAVAVLMADGSYGFDRRVRGGSYEIYIRDANGCIYGPVDVVVNEPAKIGAVITQSDVTCWTDPDNVQATVSNGTITVTPTGGWNLVDGFNYYIKLFRGATQVGSTMVQDVAAAYTFTGLTTGSYRVEIEEYNPNMLLDGLRARPWITYPDYFARASEYAQWLPYQNPSAQFSCPVFTQNVTVGIADPIDYDINFVPITCYNSATGRIEISNVTGGVGPYWFAISGPAGSGFEADPLSAGYTGWRPANTIGAYAYNWTGLIHGHYNIYIRDSRGCTIHRESGEVNNRPELVMNMLLIDNANCNDGLGEFEIQATGGTGEYEYAVIEATFFQPGYTPTEDMWQSSATFNKPAGVWIGWVRDAQFPTCYTGAATTTTGAVIQPHRVVILEPTAVVLDQPTSGFEGRTTCYETTDGKIFVKNLMGGNGDYRAVVEGYPYDGTVVFNYTEADFMSLSKPVTGWNLTLGNLPPSTDKLWNAANIVQADMYRVIFYDKNDCASEAKYVSVHRPEEFIIELKTTQDVFVCHSDLAGLFEIVVVQGGTPFGLDGNNKGIYEYYWEAIDTITGNVVHKGDWGFTPTFLGYGGFRYEVKARDANGCEADTEEYVASPAPVVIEEIKDITCYGATMASARITVSGEEGRTFRVRTLRFAGETDYLPWSDWSAEFTEFIELNNFSYGDESETDGHYKFEVMDDKGCVSEIEIMTFVPVQHPLALIYSLSAGECTADGNATITGGISPYQIYVDDVLVTGEGAINTPISFNVHAGTSVIRVVDAHECVITETVTVEANPVTDADALVTYVGEDIEYVNEEYGVDEMLNFAGSPYTFTYETEEGCIRTLTVTITEIVRQVTIAEVQGDSWESPVKGTTRGVTGTVTGFVPGVGYYIQDAVAPWSGIWVADAETVVLEGNGIHVEGVVQEVNGITTIVGIGSVVNPPLTITPIVVDSPEAAKDEMYESVLVTVEGARANAAKPDGTWDVYTTTGNIITIGKWMYLYTPEAGDFYDITGIVNGALDLYRLDPRKTADVVNLRTTPSPIIETIDFKVYPNPFNTELNIDNHSKLTRVTVTNIAGQRVLDVQYPERVIRTANLVSGVYVVTLFTEDGIAKSERIVKR